MYRADSYINRTLPLMMWWVVYTDDWLAVEDIGKGRPLGGKSAPRRVRPSFEGTHVWLTPRIAQWSGPWTLSRTSTEFVVAGC